MATTDIEPSELTKWDPGLTERVMGIMRPFLKRYFRSEVRGLENLPPGGALLRTSVMATHDAEVLDRALDRFSEVKATFEAEHGPLPASD